MFVNNNEHFILKKIFIMSNNSQDRYSIKDRSYISRDEFEVFEKNVDRSFTDLAKAVSNLSSKIDKMGSTDWKTLGMFAALILTAISLGGSLVVREINTLSNVIQTSQIRTTEKFKEYNEKLDHQDAELDQVIATRWSRSDHELYSAIERESIKREISRLESLIDKSEETLTGNVKDLELRIRNLEITK